jgi:hypothetical protein
MLGSSSATGIEARKTVAMTRARRRPSRLLGRHLRQAGAVRVRRHQHPGQVERVEDDRSGVSTVAPEDLRAEGKEGDPAEVEEVEADQAPVEADDAGEEAVVNHPEAPDDSEADRVCEKVLALFPEDLGEVIAVDVLRHAEVEHEQRFRDRENAVAECNDARELNLILLSPPNRPLSRHGPMIETPRDGTAIPRMTRAPA